MDEPKVEIQICDYGNINMLTQQITTKIILLKDEDLSQLLQSLKDKIIELEIKLNGLTP